MSSPCGCGGPINHPLNQVPNIASVTPLVPNIIPLTPIGPTEYISTIKTIGLSQTGPTGNTGFIGLCTACNSPAIPISCATDALRNIGVDVSFQDNIVTLSATELVIDTTRVSNAISSAGQQLPNGSFENYITGILDNVSSTITDNAKEIFLVTIFSIIIQSFVFFLIICVILIIYNVIPWEIGTLIILFGLLIAVITFSIMVTEASRFGTAVSQEVSVDTTGILSNLTCAVNSAVCCYSGFSCCCPSGPGPTCTNGKFPPLIEPKENLALIESKENIGDRK